MTGLAIQGHKRHLARHYLWCAEAVVGECMGARLSRLAQRGKRVVAAILVLMAGGACQGPVPVVWNLDARTTQPSPPLVTRTFVAFGHAAGVTLVDQTGVTKCSFDSHGSVVAAPHTDGHLLYFGSTNHVFYAIDTDCKLQWKRATGGALAGAAEVVGDTVYIGSEDGHVYALQADNGAVRWMFPAAMVNHVVAVPPPAAPPTPEEARAAARAMRARWRYARRHRGENALEVMSALPDPGGAAAAPASPPPPPPYVAQSFGAASVVVADGVVYAGNEDHKLYALDASNGTIRWQFTADDAVSTAPLVAHEAIYFGAANGDVYAVDKQTHTLVWKASVASAVTSSPRVFNDTLVVATAGRHLVGLEVASGKAKWDFTTPGVVHHPPVMYQGVLLASGGLGGGNVFGVRMHDNEVVWQVPVRGDTESTLEVSEKNLYVLTGSGGLSAFDLGAWARPVS